MGKACKRRGEIRPLNDPFSSKARRSFEFSGEEFSKINPFSMGPNGEIQTSPSKF